MLVDESRRPVREPRDPNRWPWWLATGLTAVVAVAVAWMAMVMAAFGIMGTWLDGSVVGFALVWLPLAIAGLLTGLVGGVRGWWLLVPTAVALVPMAVAPWIGSGTASAVMLGVGAVAAVVASWLVRRSTG